MLLGVIMSGISSTCLAVELADSDPWNTKKILESIFDQGKKEEKIKHTYRVDKRGLLFQKDFVTCTTNYLAFSPDGNTLATCGEDGGILLLDTRTGSIRNRLELSDLTFDVEFNPKEKMLASAWFDVRIWNLVTSKVLHTLKGHNIPVFDLEFNNDGRLLATIGWDHTLNLWDMKTGWHIWESKLPKFAARSEEDTVLAFTADSKKLVFYNGVSIIFLSVATGKILSSLGVHHPGRTRALITLSPDASWLAETLSDSSIRLYNARSGRYFRTLKGHKLWIYAMIFSNDSLLLLSAGSDHKLIVWDVKTGRVRKTWMIAGPNDRYPSELAISSNNRYVATRGSRGVVRVWDMTQIKDN